MYGTNVAEQLKNICSERGAICLPRRRTAIPTLTPNLHVLYGHFQRSEVHECDRDAQMLHRRKAEIFQLFLISCPQIVSYSTFLGLPTGESSGLTPPVTTAQQLQTWLPHSNKVIPFSESQFPSTEIYRAKLVEL